jgi:hypothetical protein
MSNKTPTFKHELHVVFEQDENSVVSWRVEVDEVIEQVEHLSYEELTAAGAPLAVLGISVLRELLCEQIIDLALSKADNYRWRDTFSRIHDVGEAEELPTGKPELRIVH